MLLRGWAWHIGSCSGGRRECSKALAEKEPSRCEVHECRAFLVGSAKCGRWAKGRLGLESMPSLARGRDAERHRHPAAAASYQEAHFRPNCPRVVPGLSLTLMATSFFEQAKTSWSVWRQTKSRGASAMPNRPRAMDWVMQSRMAITH